MSHLQVRNLISLLNISATIALATYLITRLPLFRKAIGMHTILRDRFILGLIFGMFSIMGTMLGYGYSPDSLMQASFIAPAIAGITVGPLSGIIAGLIGGVYALFIPSVSASAAFFTCILAGFSGGLLCFAFKHRRLHFIPGYLLGLLCEAFWYGSFLITNSFSSLSQFYTGFYIPSTLIINPIGIGLILIFLNDINRGKELRGAEYSDRILRIIDQSVLRLPGELNHQAAENVVDSIYDTADFEVVGIRSLEGISYQKGELHGISFFIKSEHIDIEQMLSALFNSADLKERPYQIIPLHGTRYRRYLVASPIIVNRATFGLLYSIAGQDISMIPVTQAISGIAALIGKRVQQNYIDGQKALLIEAEYQTLKAQINPHFLFNTLSVINTLTRVNPQEAQKVIMNLANYFRYTLNAGQDLVTVAKELEVCSLFLSIQKARYQDKLMVLIDIAPECSELLIPAFTIQPLVENAFKHALSDLTGEMKIGIQARIRNHTLHISVQDNGGGFPADVLNAVRDNRPLENHGIGLTNISQRLRILYGESCTLKLSNVDNGAKIELQIPLLDTQEGEL